MIFYTVRGFSFKVTARVFAQEIHSSTILQMRPFVKSQRGRGVPFVRTRVTFKFQSSFPNGFVMGSLDMLLVTLLASRAEITVLTLEGLFFRMRSNMSPQL